MSENVSKHFEKLEKDDKYILGKIQLNGILYYISEDKNIYSKSDEDYVLIDDENIVSSINKVLFPPSKDVIR